MKVRFTGPFRLGNAPVIYTEYPISRPTEPSKRGKFVFKITIVHGGKDNAIAIGLGVKQDYKLGFDDTKKEKDVYVYKYHGRNGYIYSQTETCKYFTEKIIRSQTYGTGDVITLRVNLGSRVATFLKNEKKVGEVFISKKALNQPLLHPFVSLNTPNAVVNAEFWNEGKFKKVKKFLEN